MNKVNFLTIVVICLSHAIKSQEQISTKNEFRPGYFCELNSGMMVSDDFRGYTHVKNGVALSPSFDFSLGLGVEGHNTGRYLPMFLEGRYNILKGKTRPFVSLNAGYLQVIEDWTYANWASSNNRHIGFSGGWRFGVQQNISSNSFFVTSVGYRFTRTQYERHTSGGWTNLPVEPVTVIHNMHRFELSIGLIFI